MRERKVISLERASAEIWERSGHRSSQKTDPGLIRKIIESRLTGKQRDYIISYYFDGQSMPDIAKKYGISVPTVSKTISRGEKRIADVLKYSVRH